jgi:lactoylglutathione lyase
LHVAFRVSLDHLLTSVPQLKRAGIEPRDFIGNPTDQPVVLAWMPAGAIYFRDLDNNQLELISMLPEAPQPELGILPWNQWVRRTPSNL